MSASPRYRSREPQPPSKRHSLTDRLLGTFNQARKDTVASIQRRASSAAAAPVKNQSPIPRVRQWLDNCNADHALHCGGDADAEALTWRPPRLIDSVDRRLVLAKPTDRYAALSYVWGVAPLQLGSGSPAQLLRTNVDAYQLSLPDDDVPRTIIDAIWLAKKLGLRYIWVDKLCILQDDEQDWIEHVQNMAHVFANAHLTIVAAHGNADTGLVALDPRRPPRAPRAVVKDHEQLLLASKWMTRAWTLQERLYSRRAVYIFEDTVNWECHCELWEGSATSVMPASRGKRHECTIRMSSAAFGFQHPPWPDLDEYARIADLCRRHAARLYRNHAHPLPELRPDCLRHTAHVSRYCAVVATAGNHPTTGSVSPAVSAILVVDGRRAAADAVAETPPAARGPAAKRFEATHSFRIKPTVTWHLTNRSDRIKVENTGLQYRDLRSRKNQGAQLPPGWSRTGSQFRHDSDPLTVFKYPLPVQDAPEEGDYAPRHSDAALPGPLLSFSTTRAFLEVDYAISMVPRDRPNPPVAVGNIWGKNNRWIGEFRAHDGWLGVQSSNYDGEERLEFIAISTAMERRGSYVFSTDRFEENMDEDEIIDIVNVLWVERIAGIAYRRGIGHIVQKHWEAEAGDEVDVLLG
ncbi:hypothetical protein HIM_08436 [Hirsutella minnesotensis 3608]|uniref:Heterokaryon incompatibility domain-containing protein n=1 Tax=Hirsutella minnesotensis 3608 TaxID=1043627 RepID=A0A0F7ZH79_9HYPO|nr:hypothetical protein HIM_08436 [Hirsutella minnesotensis 3608]